LDQSLRRSLRRNHIVVDRQQLVGTRLEEPGREASPYELDRTADLEDQFVPEVPRQAGRTKQTRGIRVTPRRHGNKHPWWRHRGAQVRGPCPPAIASRSVPWR